MTAHSGAGWKLAPSLIAMESEANRIAPGRSKASDGSIGDVRHQHESFSDHNPHGGYVHALDLTQDAAHGFDCHAHFRQIAARRDPRVKYLISLRQIWTPSKGWKHYSGDPHENHGHVSIKPDSFSVNDTSPWFGALIPFPSPTTPTPIPTPDPLPLPTKDDDMELYELHVSSGAPEVWVFRSDGTRKIVPTPEYLSVLQRHLGGVTVILDPRESDVLKDFYDEVI